MDKADKDDSPSDPGDADLGEFFAVAIVNSRNGMIEIAYCGRSLDSACSISGNAAIGTGASRLAAKELAFQRLALIVAEQQKAKRRAASARAGGGYADR